MLGRGLESLIPKRAGGEPNNPPAATPQVAEPLLSPSEPQSPAVPPYVSKPSKFQRPESVFQIEVDKIKPNPYQPRREFNAESLKELAQSIREFGILQPLVVSKVEKEVETGTDVEYQLIAGERRLLAAKMIGLPSVPVIVKKVSVEKAKLEMALIENIQRADLNPLEAAKGYARLQDEFGLTQREVAARVGKSRESIANTLRLLHLPSEIQLALQENKINESQARTLLAVVNPEEQLRAFNQLLTQKVSVRILRGEITQPKLSDPEQVFLQKKLEERLGATVKLIKHGERGKIIINYFSEDEWRGLLDRLLGEFRE